MLRTMSIACECLNCMLTSVDSLTCRYDSTLLGFQCSWKLYMQLINALRPRQNGCYFPDSIFKCIVLNAKVRISIKVSLKLVPVGPIKKAQHLVQIMDQSGSGDKPLSEPMVVRLLTHKCVTRPQQVKYLAAITIHYMKTNKIWYKRNVHLVHSDELTSWE